MSLQTQLISDLPRVLGDRVQLQQVILNLMLNAIQAMSGTVECPRRLEVISEKLRRQNGLNSAKSQETGVSNTRRTEVLVTVRDSGPGLDPQNIDRLFGPFYTTKPHGLGMGLAICRSIIEAHEGRLWAKPNVPRGAIFQFAAPGDM